MMKNSKLSILLRGIVTENPVLILILGTCPTLAMTTGVISAFSMGIAATIVLICSNVAISALRKIIPDSVRIPCYIVIISGFVTAVQMLLQVVPDSVHRVGGVCREQSVSRFLQHGLVFQFLLRQTAIHGLVFCTLRLLGALGVLLGVHQLFQSLVVEVHHVFQHIHLSPSLT